MNASSEGSLGSPYKTPRDENWNHLWLILPVPVLNHNSTGNIFMFLSYIKLRRSKSNLTTCPWKLIMCLDDNDLLKLRLWVNNKAYLSRWAACLSWLLLRPSSLSAYPSETYVINSPYYQLVPHLVRLALKSPNSGSKTLYVFPCDFPLMIYH